MFRSLLVAIDLSPVSSLVLARAMLLPLADGARVTVLHTVPKGLSRKDRLRAEGDARKALGQAVRSMGSPKRIQVRQTVRVGVAAAEIAREARTSAAELIVTGGRGGRPVRELFLGSTAERVIRSGQLPVLIVRRPPRGPYRRPVLALDMDQAARSVLALAFRLLAPPRPRLEVVHAYEPLYSGLMYPSLSAEQGREYRERFREDALRDVARFMATTLEELTDLPEDELSWRPHVRWGSPRREIPRIVTHTRADLLVLGTHGRAGLAHALLGSVAGDVLREVRCDVLVVPPQRRR